MYLSASGGCTRHGWELWTCICLTWSPARCVEQWRCVENEWRELSGGARMEHAVEVLRLCFTMMMHHTLHVNHKA